MKGRHVIVFGPAGCGKTYNRDRLAEHFSCTAIVDEASNLAPPPRAERPTLYLTMEADLRVEGPALRVSWRRLQDYGFRPLLPKRRTSK